MTPDSITRLLVVGASARAAAWSARQAGFEVVAADLFADTDLQKLAEAIQIEACKYPQALSDLVRGTKAIVNADAWVYTGCLENYPNLVREMSGELLLLGNNSDAIGRVRDPFCLARFFFEEGISFPSTANIDQITNTTAPSSCWLLKPFLSGGGHHVRRLEMTNWSPGRTRKLYLQQFIDGKPHSAVYVANGKTCDLVGVTRMWCERDLNPNATRHEFRYCGSSGPVGTSQTQTRQWQRIGNAIVRHAGLRGVFGVDAIVSGGTDASVVWPIEINPRYTASAEVLERSLNTSLIARHVRVWLGPSECNTAANATGGQAPRIYGKRILYASRPVIFDQSLYDSLLAWQAGHETRQIADQPRPGATIGAQAPICTLIACADTVSEVETVLGFNPTL